MTTKMTPAPAPAEPKKEETVIPVAKEGGSEAKGDIRRYDISITYDQYP